MTMLGKRHSEETKRRMRENHPRYWQGKNMPDEARKKISKSLIGNKNREGVAPWNKKDGRQEKANRDRFYKKRREWLDELKSKSCMDCGGKFPPECMDFDHRNGDEKVFSVNQVLKNMKQLLEEIKKCDLICANCHRVRTRKRQNGTYTQVINNC